MRYTTVRLLKLCNTFQKGSTRSVKGGSLPLKQQIRCHSDDIRMFYRTSKTPHEKDLKLSNYFGAFFWWWMTYNILTADYEEFFGPFMPDPSKWTDEELGIPPLENN